MISSELKQEVDSLVAADDAGLATQRLAESWRREPTVATASFVISRFEALRERLPLLPFRLAILRSFTVEPLIPLLRAACFVIGVDLVVYTSDFNAYAQELLDPASFLYSFRPEAVILAVQTRDIAPELWNKGPALAESENDNVASRVAGGFRDWISAFRECSQAHLIIHSLDEPLLPDKDLVESPSAPERLEVVRKINAALQDFATELAGVYLLDYDGLIARHGRRDWYDERMWTTARLPIASANLIQVVKEWMRFVHPLTGKVAKALAVDLDNTLWAGVVGEDGYAGIQLTAAHQEFQRALLELRERGILLAVCSKNNSDEALHAISHHPEMLLRPSDFAALRINWNSKAPNLREIASELNIGLDAIAFIDDNPVELEQVRAELPEVIVIDLPDQPAEFAEVVRQSPYFARLQLSTEDRERGGHYAGQRARKEIQRQCRTLEDFFRSLDQQAEIVPLTTAIIPRVAQLTQKTNQFNLTTRRYSEQQIEEMLKAGTTEVLSLRVRDRFGDNGLVGVAIINLSGDVWEIETFLLSCRVIGRTIETAFLSYLVNQARQAGARRIQGWFLPTKKNTPAGAFYPDHGFSLVEESETGSLWALDLDLSGARINCPEWIQLTIPNGEPIVRTDV